MKLYIHLAQIKILVETFPLSAICSFTQWKIAKQKLKLNNLLFAILHTQCQYIIKWDSTLCTLGYTNVRACIYMHTYIFLSILCCDGMGEYTHVQYVSSLKPFCFSEGNPHSSPLFLKHFLEILKLSDVIFLQNSLFMHDFHADVLPPVFRDFFKPVYLNSSTPQYIYVIYRLGGPRSEYADRCLWAEVSIFRLRSQTVFPYMDWP